MNFPEPLTGSLITYVLPFSNVISPLLEDAAVVALRSRVELDPPLITALEKEKEPELAKGEKVTSPRLEVDNANDISPEFMKDGEVKEIWEADVAAESSTENDPEQSKLFPEASTVVPGYTGIVFAITRSPLITRSPKNW